MAKDYVPTRESELAPMATNFNTRISEGPEAYGVSTTQATTLAQKVAVFSSAYEDAINPLTRTPAKIQAKNDAKADMVGFIRLIAAIVQSNPAVTNEMRIALGLNVRKPEPTPINPPQDAPELDILHRMGTMIRVRLHDGTARRGKPDGVAGANIYTFVGEQPPTDTSQWRFEGNRTRTVVDLAFPHDLPAGTVVWVTAFWFNPRGQTGPGSAPVSAILAGGEMSQAA